MPILHVRIVQQSLDPTPNLAQTIADAAGAIFQSKPNGTWVTIDAHPMAAYAENGGAKDLPVFVDVVLGQWPELDAMRRQAFHLAEAVARACGRPAENIHILFAPPAKGRIAFGGNLS